MLEALQDLIQPVTIVHGEDQPKTLTISRASEFLLCTMVYSNGRKKSFWNLKCDNSSFSKKFMASCLRASKAKKLMLGLL